MLRERGRVSLLQEGMKLVIAGRPNAGKSSLLNALSAGKTAPLSPRSRAPPATCYENTSRSTACRLHIVDTAGLRESGDAVEQEGIRRAWQEMASADRILLVIDGDASSDSSVDANADQPGQRSTSTKPGISPSQLSTTSVT